MYYMPYDLMIQTFESSYRQKTNEAKAYRSWQSISNAKRRLARLLSWGTSSVALPRSSNA
jgi:hypothetical protein